MAHPVRKEPLRYIDHARGDGCIVRIVLEDYPGAVDEVRHIVIMQPGSTVEVGPEIADMTREYLRDMITLFQRLLAQEDTNRGE